MKKLSICILIALTLVGCHHEFKQIYSLDGASLSDYTFDSVGAWTGTYQGEISPFTIGEFTFTHFGTPDYYGYPNWEGWTICKATNTTYTGDYYRQQWNIVSGGGCAGTATPYILAYCGNYNVPNDIYFSASRSPKEISFCQSAWSLAAIQGNDTYARKFEQGDYLTITIHALDAEGQIIEGKNIVYYLADYRAADPADWHLNTGWERCELTALGRCYGLRFTFYSTDCSNFNGQIQSNTAQYFAIERLIVEE